MNKIYLLLILFVFLCNVLTKPTKILFDSKVCKNNRIFDDDLRKQITSKSEDVNKIIDYVLNGPDKGVTYNELAKFVDKFGSRLAGTQNLDNAIDYMVDLLKKENHDNVHTEEVTVPKWVRGKECAYMVEPRVKKLSILGLGESVGTDGKVITAPVMVVKNFQELTNRSNEVKGKIVVYNFDFISYGVSVQYRSYGASNAAKFGAVAALVRSVAPFSINSPHTGTLDYVSGIKKIPSACITIEDAELFHRMSLRGENITIKLYMEAKNYNSTTSRNTISEIKGQTHPEQIVIVSGHLDSWDVGQGAMDDGGGAFISWRALSVLRKLNLTTKRTIQSVLWTAEEEGLYGAQGYVQQHYNELRNISLAMESDIGTFTPFGLTYSGNSTKAQCIMQETLNLLAKINSTNLSLSNEGSDITLLINKGVPGSSLQNKNQRYFYFHHSEGDTMTVENANDLDLCTIVWAATSYVIASLDDMLPR